MNIGFGRALCAGALSFLSPCVLPLIPGYISMMTGLSLQEIETNGRSGRRRAGIASTCFVLGFALAFTALGALASEVTAPLTPHLPALKRLSSLIVIAFGLHLTDLFPIQLLYKPMSVPLTRFSAGAAGAFAMGLAFAFGWVPCVGPVLGGILALSAGESVARGSALLFTYSLGLGLPFIAAGLATSSLLSIFARYPRFIRAGEVVSGALLTLMGVMLWCRAIKP
ncbi:MAG: cytochrome c biogenesis protein CcdA [Elusimicrobia bacterium]|nr:cytochrome c biogenesis protein CcdA [Elusimicrobiota bacterium]